MQYQEYKPSKALEAYIKCYYSLKNGNGTVLEDQAFATGCIEIMFTLNGSNWQTKVNGAIHQLSPVGLWGQILEPLTFSVSGQSEVFGIRFYPSSAAILLRDDINRFNNGVVDLTEVMGNTITRLYEKLQEAKSVQEQINLTDAYLIRMLTAHPKTIQKIGLVQQVMNDFARKDFFDNIENVAACYGITARYLQKIFIQHTGLTPKLYAKINRFQNSLVLLGKSNQSLTGIAYECGYFDQSHFIREFKTFTGITPSAFNANNSTAVLASPNK